MSVPGKTQHRVAILRERGGWMRALLLGAFMAAWPAAGAASLAPAVEIEEDVYTYTNANNGAGPMWCHGSTCLARVGEQLFASGLETVPEVPPLNNCRWMLFERRAGGWRKLRVDQEDLTREPAPMVAFADGRFFLSVNPTLARTREPGGGPARPDVLEFLASKAGAPPVPTTPVWQGQPPFREHSYRSFAADGTAGELILFQNIEYTHAEWSFRDRGAKWSSQGRLEWPWGKEYDRPQPIRVCYPNVALRDRAVHFCGVSDITEPYTPWREFKRQLTGNSWDYDFRRLFYTWTPDITKKPFGAWIEIASRDKTCGWISPGDMHLGTGQDVHLVWSERALDERLRPKFFPNEKQSHSLNYALLRDGKVVRRRTLENSTEDRPALIGSGARFQASPEGRLIVVYYATGKDESGKGVSENRAREILADGRVSEPVRLPLQRPFASYFTATPRAGSPPSRSIDMLGERTGSPGVISYARVRLY